MVEMSAEPSAESKGLEEREEIRQLKELIKALDDTARDVQYIATGAEVYLDVEEIPPEKRKRPLSSRNNFADDISEIKRIFSILKYNLCPRIEFNPNVKMVEEVLEKELYKILFFRDWRTFWDDKYKNIDTNAGECKGSVLIDMSSNLYTVASYLKLVLEKVETAEIKSSEVTNILIESTAKDLLSTKQGLVAYEKNREPLSEALAEMWRLHGGSFQWQSIAPEWEKMNKSLDLIGAAKLYELSLAYYEAFEEKYDDLHTFKNDERGYAMLRNVLSKIDRFVRHYKPKIA